MSAKPTDEVFSEAHLYCTYTYIAASRPVTYGKTGTAGDRWSPLRVEIGSDKTVAIRTTGNCSDLVQNLVCTPAFPFEGKVSAKPTDEVFFQ